VAEQSTLGITPRNNHFYREYLNRPKRTGHKMFAKMPDLCHQHFTAIQKDRCRQRLKEIILNYACKHIKLDLRLANKRRIQMTYLVHVQAATYSASVVEPATRVCFLLHQVTGPCFKRRRLPVLDLQSVTSLA
jgi:hypothetical protein